MRDVAGVVCLLIAAWFAWASWRRVRLFRARAAQGIEAPPLHPSLRLMADIGPGFVQLFAAVAALQIVGAFLVTGGAGLFSWLDLAGFLAVLVAYAAWVTVKSRFRV